MFNVQDLIGALMQGGLTRSGGNRIEHALGAQGVGRRGGALEQLLGGSSAGTAAGAGGVLGSLAQRAQGMFNDASRSVKSGNPAAIGGLGALAGALLGGGGGSVKGAIGGGALALLGGLALDAFRGMSQGEESTGKIQPSEVPVGMRPPTSAAEERELESTALLILKAMINAAKADGQISDDEIRRIVGKLGEEGGVDPEAQAFVRSELSRPLDLQGLIRDVPNQRVGAEVYAASLLAIEVDTPAERDYLRSLAQGLGLEDRVVQRLHGALGIA